MHGHRGVAERKVSRHEMLAFWNLPRSILFQPLSALIKQTASSTGHHSTIWRFSENKKRRLRLIAKTLSRISDQ
jgi:hypothetical protein